MATKKTTKTVTKKATKRAAKKVAVHKTEFMHVISQRSKLFKWDPIEAYSTYELAQARRKELENSSIYGGNGYKQTRVVVKG